MGLQDFWDNVRTPGFMGVIYEELVDMCKETKKEWSDLIKEGEEVFIDGFQEIVLNENPAYKNSFEKRAEAKQVIDEIQMQMFSARGLVDGGNRYMLRICANSIKNAAVALLSLERAKINEIIAQLETKYSSFAIFNPEDLLLLSDRINDLLALPDAPKYSEKSDEEQVAVLAPSFARQKRVAGANQYLSEAKEYANEMAARVSIQSEAGIMFDCSKLEGKLGQLLESYERRLAIENGSIKYLVESDEPPDHNDWLMVRLVLLLASGMHAIVRLGFIPASEVDMPERLMEDLALGLSELANRYKGSILAKYLADVEEVNGVALAPDADNDER